MPFLRNPLSRFTVIGLLVVLMAGIGLAGAGAVPGAAAVNPDTHRQAYEAAKKDAEVLVEVRCIGVVCAEAVKDGDKVVSVRIHLALQVLSVEKGPVKKNDIVVVSHSVTLPSGPGPGGYGYTASLFRFPFTPGAKGSVALRWDKDARAHIGIAGWVPRPNRTEIPTEVGTAILAK